MRKSLKLCEFIKLSETPEVWHGTPHHIVDKFSTNNIGTGEGNQSYGWGLYFTGNKEIAEYYKRTLTSNAPSFTYAPFDVYIDDKKLKHSFDINIEEPSCILIPYCILILIITSIQTKKFSPYIQRIVNYSNCLSYIINSNLSLTENVKSLIDWLIKYIDINYTKNEKVIGMKVKDLIEELQRYLDLINQNRLKIESHEEEGEVLKVYIPEGKYLLWDKEFKKQSAFVQKALYEPLKKLLEKEKKKEQKKELITRKSFRIDVLKEKEKEKTIDEMINKLTGSFIYFRLELLLDSSKKASLFLHSLGLNGIKYYTAESRNKKGYKESGDFNYVIFDDNAIKILERM